jgi:agmatine deiminase
MKNDISRILPSEWVTQDFVQLTWPHEQTDWAYMLNEVNACFANIARAITKYQNLKIVCKDKIEVAHLLDGVDMARVQFYEMLTNDTWARDHGGITVFESGCPVICDFTFNGWGLKFASHLDNKITRQMFESGAFGEKASYRNHLKFVLEGGSIESDGKGTLLTTSQCLLSGNRNHLSKFEVDEKLKEFFGLKRVLWLNHGYLAGDDTDSHVDTLARFCDENTIAYVQCDDMEDEHYEELKLMERELQQFTTIDGAPYHLVPLPMADCIVEDGERLPATYANFLIINEAVLVPTYRSDKDTVALNQLKKIFANREVIGIDCRALISQHGSLHCVTMQYPSKLE